MSAPLPSDPSEPENPLAEPLVRLSAILRDVDEAALAAQIALNLGKLDLVEAYLTELRGRVADMRLIPRE